MTLTTIADRDSPNGSRLYSLAPTIKYRREWFGGLVYCSRSKETRFFNHAAAFALEQFRDPITFINVQAAMNGVLREPSKQTEFFGSLEVSGIIQRVTQCDDKIGELFF